MFCQSSNKLRDVFSPFDSIGANFEKLVSSREEYVKIGVYSKFL